MLYKINVSLFLLACVLFTACSADRESASESEQVVNVYSHRHYEADKTLYKQFEEKTGIKVQITTAKADELIKRLEIEGDLSPADILITVDAGRLERAKNKGLLQSTASEILEAAVPPALRDPDNQWFALTSRARIVVYALDRVSPADIPTYEALAEPQWNGRVLVRAASSIYNQSLLAGMIAHAGEENAKAWAAGIVKNMARTPRGGDRDQMAAIAAGVGDVAIVNSYYLGSLSNSPDSSKQAIARSLGICFPNQEGRGAHINISGGGITKSSKNTANARKLLEFLASPEAQEVYAAVNNEYPVNPNATVPELLKSWGSFKADSLDLSKLNTYHSAAVKLFDEVGWQ